MEFRRVLFRSETSTAAYEPALTTNSQPSPIAAISTPATAGPSIRAALKEAEFSATAFARSSSLTRSDTNACRAGASNAVTQPTNNAKPYTCQSYTTPARVSRPTPNPPTDRKSVVLGQRV